MAPRAESDGGDIYAPEGSRVTVRVTPKTTTAPVATAAIVLRDGKEVPLAAEGAAVRGRAGDRRRHRVSRAPARHRWPRKRRGPRVLRPPSRRPPARRAHHPSGRRQARHAARRGDHRGARRRRPRARSARAGRRRARQQREGRAAWQRRRAVDHRPAHRVSGGPRRQAGRLRQLLRAGARRRPRQAAHRVAQRHLLPRGDAVCGRVRHGAEPGHGRRRRPAGRRPGPPAEGHHRRHVEAAAPGGRRQRGRLGRRRQDARPGASGAAPACRDCGPAGADAGRAGAGGLAPSLAVPTTSSRRCWRRRGRWRAPSSRSTR